MHDIRFHAYLLKRLLAVFAVLSLVVCCFDYFYELEKVDEQVMRLALDEAGHFAVDEARLLTSGDVPGLTARTREHLLSSSFMVIEFYDRAGIRLVEEAKPGAEEIEAAFNKLPHRELLGPEPRYQKLEHRDRLFLRVAVPLHASGGIVGYLEGIYAVGDSVMEGIREQMAVSLSKVVLVVFMTTLVLYPVIVGLNRRVVKFASVLLEANVGVLESLGNAVAKRDSDTSEHNYRVTLYAIALGEKLGLDKAAMRELVKGAFLHDIGKIAIPDAILLKPGKLTEDEFARMKSHVRHGVEILKDYQWLQEASSIVEHHHEKVDGTGYAKGLKGEEVPLGARIFAIVDVFDALTSERPYKQAFSYDTSVGILRDGRDKHFDGRILDAFLEISGGLHVNTRSLDEAGLKRQLRSRISAIFQ